MRILFIVPDSLQPANSGGRIRGAAIAAGLAASGEVVVAALDEIDRTDPWGVMCRAMAARRVNLALRLVDRVVATVRGYPAQLERAIAAGAAGAFSSLLDRTNPSLVVLSRPCFGPFIDLARSRGVPVVADVDESLVRAMGSVLRSKASIRQRVRALSDLVVASRYERREYRLLDQVWVSTPIEHAWFEPRVHPAAVFEIPNLARAPASPPTAAGAITAIGFVGTYSYAPNEEAALHLIRDVMPAIRAAGGPTELVLIGRDPTAAMTRAAAASGGEVRITGTVPDPIPVLRACGILVAPIHAGAGSRIKILEALRARVPVITTRQGLEGLAAVPTRDVLVAETPAEIARAVRSLMEDELLRQRLVHAGSAFVEANHSEAAIGLAVTRAVQALPTSTSQPARP